MLHGTASKTCVAQRMFNLPRGSDSRCSKPNMPSSELSFTITQPLRPQNQPGKPLCSAAGSFWDDLQSTPLRAIVRTSWMRAWSFFGLRIGLLFGPWYVLNVMSLHCRTRRAGQKSSKCSHVFAKLLHWRVLVKKDELWQPHAPPVPVTEQIVSRDQEPLSCGSRATGTSVSSNFSPVLV